MKKILLIILIMSISLATLAISIEFNSYNKGFYIKSYEKYNIPEITNKSIEELSEITNNIIFYLKAKGKDELLNPYFNEREVLHMRDVQRLFNLNRWIKYIGIVLSIIIISYFYKKNKLYLLGKGLALGLFGNHIILGILGILASIDFNKYFTYFHLIFFTNDLWILNPKTDLMIQMLPEKFFMNMALRILLSFFIFLSIIQIVSYLLIKKGKDNNGRAIKENKEIFYRK